MWISIYIYIYIYIPVYSAVCLIYYTVCISKSVKYVCDIIYLPLLQCKLFLAKALHKKKVKCTTIASTTIQSKLIM